MFALRTVVLPYRERENFAPRQKVKTREEQAPPLPCKRKFCALIIYSVKVFCAAFFKKLPGYGAAPRL